MASTSSTSSEAVTPSDPMPQISPTSRPAFAALCTQAPASSSSGCETIASTAARPRFPVAHWMTRIAMSPPNSQPSSDELALMRVPHEWGRCRTRILPRRNHACRRDHEGIPSGLQGGPAEGKVPPEARHFLDARGAARVDPTDRPVTKWRGSPGPCGRRSGARRSV